MASEAATTMRREATAAARVTARAQPARAGGPVLVIDDDEDVIVTIDMILHEEAIEAVSARGADEALDALGGRRPSLVLLDYWLGTEEAPEVAARLRRHFSGVPIVLLSGSTHLGRPAREVGAVATLAKPFAFDDLLECIGRHRR